MKDILIILATINVYGMKIYSKSYSNIDTGKNNLYSILWKKGFTVSRIVRTVKLLKQEGLLIKEWSDNGNFFSVTSDRNMQKLYLQLME